MIAPEAQDFVKKLLEKNRQKRPSLEEVLQHKWFEEFKEIHDLRKNKIDSNGLDNKFKNFTITAPDSPKIQQDMHELINEHSL